jgi:hypothetical protein
MRLIALVILVVCFVPQAHAEIDERLIGWCSDVRSG